MKLASNHERLHLTNRAQVQACKTIYGYRLMPGGSGNLYANA